MPCDCFNFTRTCGTVVPTNTQSCPDVSWFVLLALATGLYVAYGQ